VKRSGNCRKEAQDTWGALKQPTEHGLQRSRKCPCELGARMGVVDSFRTLPRNPPDSPILAE